MVTCAHDDAGYTVVAAPPGEDQPAKSASVAKLAVRVVRDLTESEPARAACRPRG
jgi:hypothetical protein